MTTVPQQLYCGGTRRSGWPMKLRWRCWAAWHARRGSVPKSGELPVPMRNVLSCRRAAAEMSCRWSWSASLMASSSGRHAHTTRVDISSGASKSGCGNRQIDWLRLAASRSRSILRDQARPRRMLGSLPINPSHSGTRRRSMRCSTRRTRASTGRSWSTEKTPPTRLPGTPIGHYTDPVKHGWQGADTGLSEPCPWAPSARLIDGGLALFDSSRSRMGQAKTK